MFRDVYGNIQPKVALVPAVQGSTVPTAAIDLKGARGVAFVISTGAVVGDGDFGVVLQESDTAESGDFADVPPEFVDSNAPATLEASSVYKLGYRGHRRFVRAYLVKEGGTSVALGAVAVLEPLDRPAA